MRSSGRNDIEGTIRAAAGVAALGGIVAEGVGGYLRDLFTGIASLFRASSEDAMSAVQRRIDVADMLVVAAMGDGLVDDAEWDALQQSYRKQPELAAELADAIVRWKHRAALFADRRAFLATLDATAERIRESDRATVFEAIVRLARVSAAAAPTVVADGYRGVKIDAHDRTRELLDRASTALRIDPELRAEITAEIDRQ